MKKIVECVPNFSEGRNSDIIDKIARSIKNTKGCTLLDVDPGKSTNRTVVTFVGSPSAVVEGALNSAKSAKKLIDMSRHKGEHPRMGAMDVCPFIPVANVTMEECVEISKEFARKAAEEIGIPIYLYEESTDVEYRKKLPRIREGEYEGLKERITSERWKPDFGPARFIPEWGATVTGARFFLIAYNVNLISTPNQAHRIALNLREAGRGRDQPGRLKEVKGMGWYVDEYNLAQVTVNLNNYLVTAPHVLFEEVKKEAARLNIAVAGSEMVGLVPLEAMLLAADYYIEKENLFIIDEDQKIRLVIERLGLNSVAPFNPEEKIIEYIVNGKKNGPLAGMGLGDFIQEVASRSAAPGGGSVSAAIAALGAGLGSMAAKLTLGVRKFEDVDSKMRSIIPALHGAARALIPMIDADTQAFNQYIKALGLPRTTKEEQEHRKDQMELGLKQAIEIPLSVMKEADNAWDALETTAKYANIASKSDMEVGAKALETGIFGAYKNVMINMEKIRDKEYKKETTALCEGIKKRAGEMCTRILNILEKRE